MKKILSVALLLAVHPLSANDLSSIGSGNFKIIHANKVSVDTQQCYVGFRKKFSKEELEKKSTYDCHGIKFENVTIELENGEIITVDNIMTPPMTELFGVTASKKCADIITSTMQKQFDGQKLHASEKFKMPTFTAFGMTADTLHVATAENKVFGSRTLGRESFSYKNTAKDINCHPQINTPNMEIVDNLYQEPTKDEGILRNMGRNAKGFGFELLRAGETGVEWVGDRFKGSGKDR